MDCFNENKFLNSPIFLLETQKQKREIFLGYYNRSHFMLLRLNCWNTEQRS